MLRLISLIGATIFLALVGVFVLHAASRGTISLNKANTTPDIGSTKVVFVGDIMLDRGVRATAAKYGKESVFAGVRHLFENVDAVIGNFEGTMTNNKSIAIPNSKILRFTFDPDFAAVLKNVGFTAFSLANNHSLDFGHTGYRETNDRLHEAGILTFGTAINHEQLSIAIDLPDMTLCLVGYHDLYVQNEEVVLKEIATIKPSCSKVVVVVHWGDEYKPKPNVRQKLLAHQFIDIGADLIIGAHPHVVQTMEEYNGKTIFYSLGNFVFDQDFSFETRHGLAVIVEWKGEETNFDLIPIAITKGIVTVAEGEDEEKVLDYLTSR